MKRAAIAIGSNSTRMLAAETTGGALRNPIRGREETRLFLGLDEAGNISPEKLEDTAQAVKRLYLNALAYGAETVDLFATSATRDAGNSADFASRIRKLTGLELRIISGEEEARLAFAAVSEGKRRLVMDIGGGSTEWTVGENNRVEWAVSMQLGASRLLKMCPIQSVWDAERALDAARRAADCGRDAWRSARGVLLSLMRSLPDILHVLHSYGSIIHHFRQNVNSKSTKISNI